MSHPSDETSARHQRYGRKNAFEQHGGWYTPIGFAILLAGLGLIALFDVRP